VPGSLFGLEVVARGEAREAGDEVRGDRGNGVVVVEGGVVVDVAGDRDLVLRLGELLLQVCEPLLGAQLGIRFGDGQEVPDGPVRALSALPCSSIVAAERAPSLALTTASRVSDSWAA